MDVIQKLKSMTERAERENFAFRFYKSSNNNLEHGSHNQSSVGNDRNFKEVEWFSHKKPQDPATQGGTLELTSPMINRMNHTTERRSSSKVSTTHHLHQTEIINSLEDQGFEANQDLLLRSTKIVCTLGRTTKQVEPIKKMIQKGMDIARLNMNYFEVQEQLEISNNIKLASAQLGKKVPIMVDLKGPLIRTLEFNDMYSIEVKTGQEIRISSNQQIKGDEGMFCLDYDNIHEKLRIGDKIIVDYGGIVLTVIGFEPEQKYFKSQEKLKKSLQEQQKSPEEAGANKTQLSSKSLTGTDSGKKRYLQRKMSANEEEMYQEEIEELINEENQDDEDVKEQDKNLQAFPKIPNLDSGRTNTEDLWQDKAIINEILKKRHQGFSASSFAKKTEKIRFQQIKNTSYINRQWEQNKPSDIGNQQDSSPPIIQNKSSSLLNYTMKRTSIEEGKDDPSPQPLTYTSSYQPSSFKLLPSKEYLSRKRMSRDEFLRDNHRILKGIKKPIRSRKSTSPTNRSHNADNNSCSISETDSLNFQWQKDIESKITQPTEQIDYFKTPLLEKDKMMVVCRVENDGYIKENKPIYIPNLDWQKDLKLSVLGQKDVKVLQNSIQQGVHIIAVSFVESKEDIQIVKRVLGHKGQHIKLLAKLQSKKAIENFDQILEVSDGIIIARGYLGVTLDLEDVVYVQKYIIKKCNMVGKPVLLSTQIMESMVSRLIPSRAEVVDISNAVYDGIDSLILSPETAIGPFYEQATEKMADICSEAEKHINYLKRYHDQETLIKSFYKIIHKANAKDQNAYHLPHQSWSTEETISSCAVKASFDVKARMIIVFTHSGITARKVAKHKPKCIVFSVTPNEWAAEAMLLHRGIEVMLVGSLVGSDTLINKVIEEAFDRKIVKKGDFVIVTSGLSGTVGSTNLLKIIKV